MTIPIDRRTTEQDVRRTGLAVLVFLLIGSVAVVSEQTRSHASAALLWSLACFVAGSLIGFLFGIPRVLQHDTVSSVSQAPNANSGNAPPAPTYSIRVNTNLEQISDWLTKIIVGITLVQLEKVPANIYRAAYFIARSVGGPEETFFAGALLIYFSVGGFLGGYLITRLFLTGAFSRADQQPTLPLSQSDQDTLSAIRPVIQDEENTLTAPIKQLADRIAQVNLDPSLSTKDVALLAKAQLLKGNAQDAVKAYEVALSRTPDDLHLRIDYAIALRKAGMPIDVVKQQLLDAYKRLTPQTDKITKQRLYNTLTYTLLYAAPPSGFTDAIKFGEEYNADSMSVPDGAIDVNLAAAYGQMFSWYKSHSDPGVNLDDVRRKALDAIKAALRKDQRWEDRLRMLLDPAYPNKDPQENDLEVFAKDQEFRVALGMIF